MAVKDQKVAGCEFDRWIAGCFDGQANESRGLQAAGFHPPQDAKHGTFETQVMDQGTSVGRSHSTAALDAGTPVRLPLKPPMPEDAIDSFFLPPTPEHTRQPDVEVSASAPWANSQVAASDSYHAPLWPPTQKAASAAPTPWAGHELEEPEDASEGPTPWAGHEMVEPGQWGVPFVVWQPYAPETSPWPPPKPRAFFQEARANEAEFVLPFRFKTELCCHFASGDCLKGEYCTYAHGEAELQSKAQGKVYDKPYGGSQFPENKTRLCRHFAAGNCRNGTQCTFAHGSADLVVRAPEEVDSQTSSLAAEEVNQKPHDKYKIVLCKHFVAGCCRNGRRCTFAHGEAELVVRAPEASDSQSSSLAAKEVSQRPHDKEIATIKKLMAWCEGVTATKEADKKGETKEIAHQLDEGMEVLTRKEDRDKYAFAPTKKNKCTPKPKANKAEAPKTIKHSLENLLLFESLGLHGPSTTADILATSKKLALLLNYYEDEVKEWEENREMTKRKALEEASKASTRPAELPPWESQERYLEQLAAKLFPETRRVENVERAKTAILSAVAVVFPDSTLEFFGSCVNGFEIPTSDVDCVVIMSGREREELQADLGRAAALARHDPVKALAVAAAEKLQEAIKDPTKVQLGMEVRDLTDMARIPVLKLRSHEGVEIDVSFNNELPLYNSKLLGAYASCHPLVKQMGRLVKHWAKERGVNNAFDGTLSSYCHILLVIHYLQCDGSLPNLQDRGQLAGDGEIELLEGRHDVWFNDPGSNAVAGAVPDGFESTPADAVLLGYLHGFFRYFAHTFNFREYVVSIRRGTLSRSEARAPSGHFMCIEDPMENGRILGPNSREGALRLKAEWRRAYDLLNCLPLRHMRLPVEELFSEPEQSAWEQPEWKRGVGRSLAAADTDACEEAQHASGSAAAADAEALEEANHASDSATAAGAASWEEAHHASGSAAAEADAWEKAHDTKEARDASGSAAAADADEWEEALDASGCAAATDADILEEAHDACRCMVWGGALLHHLRCRALLLAPEVRSPAEPEAEINRLPVGLSKAVDCLTPPPPLGLPSAVDCLTPPPPPGLSKAVDCLTPPPPGLSNAVDCLAPQPPPGLSKAVGCLTPRIHHHHDDGSQNTIQIIFNPIHPGTEEPTREQGTTGATQHPTPRQEIIRHAYHQVTNANITLNLARPHNMTHHLAHSNGHHYHIHILPQHGSPNSRHIRSTIQGELRINHDVTISNSDHDISHRLNDESEASIRIRFYDLPVGPSKAVDCYTPQRPPPPAYAPPPPTPTSLPPASTPPASPPRTLLLADCLTPPLPHPVSAAPPETAATKEADSAGEKMEIEGKPDDGLQVLTRKRDRDEFYVLPSKVKRNGGAKSKEESRPNVNSGRPVTSSGSNKGLPSEMQDKSCLTSSPTTELATEWPSPRAAAVAGPHVGCRARASAASSAADNQPPSRGVAAATLHKPGPHSSTTSCAAEDKPEISNPVRIKHVSPGLSSPLLAMRPPPPTPLPAMASAGAHDVLHRELPKCPPPNLIRHHIQMPGLPLGMLRPPPLVAPPVRQPQTKHGTPSGMLRPPPPVSPPVPQPQAKHGSPSGMLRSPTAE